MCVWEGGGGGGELNNTVILCNTVVKRNFGICKEMSWEHRKKYYKEIAKKNCYQEGIWVFYGFIRNMAMPYF